MRRLLIEKVYTFQRNLQQKKNLRIFLHFQRNPLEFHCLFDLEIMKKTSLLLTIILVLVGALFGVWYFNVSHSCSAFSAECKENTAEQKGKIYLDVREEEEWIAGHVKGALHIKMGDIFAGNYEQIPQTNPVYVYCRSGRRAGEVIRFLEQKGFKNLINAGGLRDIEGVEIVEGE